MGKNMRGRDRGRNEGERDVRKESKRERVWEKGGMERGRVVA